MKALCSRGGEERVDLEESADSIPHGRYYLELLTVDLLKLIPYTTNIASLRQNDLDNN